MKLNKLSAAMIGLLVSTGSSHAVTPAGALPNAKPGECYAQVVTPARYRMEESTVVVREASEKLRIIPAEFKSEERRVLVSEASSKLKVVPAKYKTETISYEVTPARTEWVIGTRNSQVPANPELLRMATAGGATLDAARPGQCFHEHYQPAKFETVNERVLISEASEQITLQDAKYEWVEQRIEVAPASSKLVEIPAQFKTIKENVLVESAKTIWKQGRGNVERYDHSSGEVMCLVEVPAKYKSLTREVLQAPATTRTITEPAQYETVRVRKLVSEPREVRKEIPAKYKTVSKRRKVAEATYVWHPVETKGHFGDKTGNVICKTEVPAKMASVERKVVATPARTERVEIPAKYETKKIRVLSADAREERTVIPAQTRTIERKVKVSDARLEWSPVLCEINATRDKITEVQSALKAAGHNPGLIDGVFGRSTMSAIESYQLATGGLTFETLRSLKISH